MNTILHLACYLNQTVLTLLWTTCYVYCKIGGVVVTPKCGVKSQCKNDASNGVSIDTKVMVSIEHHVSLHITHSSWHHRKFPTTLSMST